MIIEDGDLAYLLQHTVVGLLVARRHVGAGLSTHRGGAREQKRNRENNGQHLKPLEPAAVYQQCLTGDKRCALRGEPHDRVGHFFRLPDALERRFDS